MLSLTPKIMYTKSQTHNMIFMVSLGNRFEESINITTWRRIGCNRPPHVALHIKGKTRWPE